MYWFNHSKITQFKQNRSGIVNRGMFETQKSGNKTSSGEIGLNIRTLASPNVGQEQVSEGVSCSLLAYRTPCIVANSPHPLFEGHTPTECHILNKVDSSTIRHCWRTRRIIKGLKVLCTFSTNKIIEGLKILQTALNYIYISLFLYK